MRERKFEELHCPVCNYLGLFVKAIGYTETEEKMEIRLGVVCVNCKFDRIVVIVDDDGDDKPIKVNYIG